MNKAFLRIGYLMAVLGCSFICSMPFAESQTSSTVDSPSLDSYKRSATGKIKSGWTVPNVDFAGCVCAFTLNKKGEVTNIRVQDSSGMPSFDSTCLSAIGNAAPFGALPQGIETSNAVARFVVGGGDIVVNLGIFPPGGSTPSAAYVSPRAIGVSSTAAVANHVDLSPYIDSVRDKILPKWTPADGSRGVITCAVSIGQSGKAEIKQTFPTTGAANFKKIACDAIAQAEPFDQLPAGLNSLNLMVTFEKSHKAQRIDLIED